MADSLPVLRGEMIESSAVSETGSDNCDNCSQGNRDDLLERDPGYVEDRFRVDRKKLEQMLQGQVNDDEGAEDFFQRIMDETNTQITWPSKLKIGAKSKKDPHIKVIGYPEDVKMAKDLIMAVLDTKSNRVTLKMDVSHTDHSHVIGKGGNNIKRVMQETGCHIHFPDSNRGNNVQEKSNQVSIAGQPDGVEKARIHIRELLPLVFMFEIPASPMHPGPDANSPAIQQLQQQFNVSISIRPRPRVYTSTTIVVRGSVNNAKNVKEATSKLIEMTTSAVVQTPVAVSMQLEIAQQHHLFIIGRGGINIKQIMQQTGAAVHFPDPNTVTPQRKGTVFITGNIDSVFLARQHLIGCLPLVLMFDVKEDIDMEQGRVTQLMEQLDVFISVKPKPKQPSKSVIVKSIERNARNMYLARSLLLGLEKEDRILQQRSPRSPISPTADVSSNNALGLTALGYFNQNVQNMLHVNTNSLLIMNGGSKSPSLGGSPHSSPSSTSASNWVPPPPGIYAPMMVLPPASTCSVQSSLDLLTQCNGLKPDLNQNSAFITVPSPLDQGSRHHSEANSPSRSPCDSPLGFRDPTSLSDIAGLSTTNSSFRKLVTDEPLSSSSSFGKIVTDQPLSSSGHTMDLLGLSKTTNVPLSSSQSLFLNSSLGSGSLHGSLSRPTLTNGDASIDTVLDTEISDKLAPGIERKNSNPNLFAPFNVDYEQKKLMANKAMQKKPIGESRIPTDFWSGLGFSKSMPESVIRERLAQGGIRYVSPMSTTYENPSQELQEIDRDPWKDTSQPPVNKPINPAPGEYPSPRKKYDYLSSSNHVDAGALPTKSNWPPKTDLAELFSTLGLGKYTDLFQQQEIDLATFLTLTDHDLRELGISTFGARRKMLLSIADLNKRRTLMSPNTGPSTPFHENGGAPGLSVRGAVRPDIASMSGRW